MSLIHLVRHGQASAGTDNYDRLSPIGHKQSELLGQWWAAQGFLPSAACHGTLERQRDTAIGAFKALTNDNQAPALDTHAGLDEYNHRVIEAHFASKHAEYVPEAMSFEDYMGIMGRWRDHRPPGSASPSAAEPAAEPDAEVEPWQDFCARGWNTLQELISAADDPRQLVCFTSGGVIATTLARVLNLDFEHTVDAIWRIRNTSITTFQIDGKGAGRLVEFNTIAHLQAQHSPELITLI